MYNEKNSTSDSQNSLITKDTEQNEIQISEFIDLRKKIILEDWLLKNIENPYPTFKTKTELCEKTQLSLKKVDAWFTWKRVQLKRARMKENDFSIEKKNILRNFFLNVNEKPNQLQIKELSEQLELPQKKIYRWFTYQRSQKKKIK
ncbi:unnamed protein product [Brachionus calyciflorus]|uniref:Homeobox domain-containing protein n=1 Tax=Brachionus calyciflorus TaxID=104777 RepID=A0A814B559_9BILA|nr:unnamed protein product [Brachionus calyciflorus]